MKHIVVKEYEDLGGLYVALKELQKMVNYHWDMKIKDEDIIIRYDDGNDDLEKILLLDIDSPQRDCLENYIGFIIIPIGINKKASITLSGIEEELVFSIQREIILAKSSLAPQDIVIRNVFFDKYDVMYKIILFSIMLFATENRVDYIKDLLNRTLVEYL